MFMFVNKVILLLWLPFLLDKREFLLEFGFCL